jgi:hypothetical protein
MDDDFLDDLPSYFRLARNSLYLSNCRTRVSAVVVRKKPLIIATNKNITHPKYVTGDDFRTSIHAEVNCCLHLSDDQCEGASIFVYREAKKNPTSPYYPALAKPCHFCQVILREKNFRKMFYSVPEYPFWRMEKL